MDERYSFSYDGGNMDNREAIQIVILIVMISGILTAAFALSSVVNEGIEAAKALDFDAWAESTIGLLLLGIFLFFASIIAELVFVVSSRVANRIV